MTSVPDALWGEFAELLLRVARELDPHGGSAPDVVTLTGTESVVMRWIDWHPGTTPSATAAATGLHRSNLSAALRELERKAMVERRATPDDGRQVQLFPTALAVENIARLRAWWAQSLSHALPADVEEREVEAALRLLTRIDDGMRAAPQPRG